MYVAKPSVESVRVYLHVIVIVNHVLMSFKIM